MPRREKPAGAFVLQLRFDGDETFVGTRNQLERLAVDGRLAVDLRVLADRELVDDRGAGDIPDGIVGQLDVDSVRAVEVRLVGESAEVVVLVDFEMGDLVALRIDMDRGGGADHTVDNSILTEDEIRIFEKLISDISSNTSGVHKNK